MANAFRLRIFFIFALFAGGFIAMFLGMHPGISIFMWLMAILLVVAYFLFGTVNTAFFTLNNGQIAETEKVLEQTIKPEWLIKSRKAYYYLIKGLVMLHKVNLNDGNEANYLKEAETMLAESLDLGLSRKQDKAMAYLNLAAIAYRNKDKEKAQKYYKGAKDYETGDLRLQKSLEDLEVAISRL